VEGETTYTVDEAARILQETPERVREMLATGDLDGIPPGATLSGEWKVLLPISLGEDSGEDALVEESSEGPAEEQDETPAVSGEEPQAPPDTAPDESPREPDEVARSNAGGSGWTTTKQAAKVLGVSRRSVQGYVRRGLLEAREQGAGVSKTFLIAIDSLNALRDQRSREANVAAKFAEASANEERSASLYANAGEALRHAIERVEARTAEATELRVRLELTEQAESTLRAELEETRRRQEEAERERDELRRELEALRERRESPVSPTPTEAPTGAAQGAQELRETTQSAAETLRVPDPGPTTPSPQASPQSPSRAGQVRDRLWRRVFGR